MTYPHTMIKGFYWHVHHDKLIEWCYNYQERVEAIKEKPKNEIETRLRLLKPVKNFKVLPKKWVEAFKKWVEADKKRVEAVNKWDEAFRKWLEADEKLDEAVKKWDEAHKKWLEAFRKWLEAYKKRDEADEKFMPELEALHKKECGCKEWNGKEIVFK